MSRIKKWRATVSQSPYNKIVALTSGLTITAALLITTGMPATKNAAEIAVALPAQATLAATQQASRLWESISIRTGDTLGRILATRGHSPTTAHAIMSAGPAAKTLGTIKVGGTLKVATDDAGAVDEISYAPDPYRVVKIRRNELGGFDSELIEKPTFTVTRFAEGVIESSLFGAGKKVGISDAVILKMADIFAYDIDFALEVQTGDTFRVMHEEILVDGEKVRDGDVLAAEFVNQGKTYRAIRFNTADGRSGYYTPDGLAMRKTFLRTPIEFARISSRFTKSRFHPVLHTFRAHKGVDYAAARGTPIKATANGRISYAGNKGGYGRTVIIDHSNQQSTLYGHMNGFAKNIRSGARVTQGQIIGYVGSTGLASGPHLHYEMRIKGVQTDPLKIKTTTAEPIAAADKKAFLAEAGKLVAMLDNYSGHTAVAQVNSVGKATLNVKL